MTSSIPGRTFYGFSENGGCESVNDERIDESNRESIVVMLNRHLSVVKTTETPVKREVFKVYEVSSVDVVERRGGPVEGSSGSYFGKWKLSGGIR